jgi:hypothetical protein
VASTAVSEGTIDATATPAVSIPCSETAAAILRKALRGPFLHAWSATCSRRSGSGVTILCGTRTCAITRPPASAAIAFTDVVPTSTPTVTTDRRRAAVTSPPT